MRRMAAWLLAAALAISLAGVRAEGLPLRELIERPWSAELCLTAQTVMPLDEERTEDLNRLLSHLSLGVDWAPDTDPNGTWASLTLRVDGAPVLELTQRSEARQTSVCLGGAERTLTFAGDPWGALLGEQTSMDYALWAERALALLPEADAWVQALAGDEIWFQVKKIQTTIAGYGKATRSLQWTQPKAEVEAFDRAVRACCPEGFLRAVLARGVFAGKQSLTLLTDSEGAVLRVTYSGGFQLEDEDKPRQVTLRWRRKRQEGDVADSLTFKSPNASGSSRDNLTLTRTEKERKGTTTLRAEFNYDHKDGKDRIRTYGTGKLSWDEGLTGSLQIKQDRSGEADGRSAWTLTPELRLRTETGLPSGTLKWVWTEDGHRQSAWTAQLALTPAGEGARRWTLPAQTVPLDGMPEAERREIWRELVSAVAPGLVRALVRLPEEDTLFISRDLPDWAGIVAGARTETIEQEADER